MSEPDLGAGRSINPGSKNAHKEARRLVLTGGGSPARWSIHRVVDVLQGTLITSLADNSVAGLAGGPLYLQLSKTVATGTTPGFKAGLFQGLMNGVITDVDTSAGSLKAPVYLSTAGGWTLTKPTAAVVRVIGEILNVGTTDGEILFWGNPPLAQAQHISPVAAVTKTANGVSTVTFDTTDLGGNYNGAPVAVQLLAAAGVITILRASWSAGTLTVVLSANGLATDRVSVIVAPTGDAL